MGEGGGGGKGEWECKFCGLEYMAIFDTDPRLPGGDMLGVGKGGGVGNGEDGVE